MVIQKELERQQEEADQQNRGTGGKPALNSQSPNVSGGNSGGMSGDTITYVNEGTNNG